MNDSKDIDTIITRKGGGPVLFIVLEHGPLQFDASSNGEESPQPSPPFAGTAPPQPWTVEAILYASITWIPMCITTRLILI